MGAYTHFSVLESGSGHDVAKIIELFNEHANTTNKPEFTDALAQATGALCMRASGQSSCGVNFSFSFASDYGGVGYDLTVNCDREGIPECEVQGVGGFCEKITLARTVLEGAQRALSNSGDPVAYIDRCLQRSPGLIVL